MVTFPRRLEEERRNGVAECWNAECCRATPGLPELSRSIPTFEQSDVMTICDNLKFDDKGLIPAIIQEQGSGRVLMMAWMNRDSLEKTVATGKTHFWSRSRQAFWMKGGTSGHTQEVKNIAFDCDGDTLLIQVEQIGAACHEGYRSCFFRSVEQGGGNFRITEPQLQTPEQIYAKK